MTTPPAHRYDRTVSPLTRLIDRQDWLQRPVERLQGAVEGLIGPGGRLPRGVANVLHGKPLGVPLHASVVHAPLGAWGVAGVLDALDAARGRSDLRPAADVCVRLGIAGAVVASLPGLADWHSLGEFRLKRRVGVVHAGLNVLALGLYGASAGLRASGRREAARGVGWAGLSVLALSGHLGGVLSYREASGANHATDIEPPADWTAVLPDADLPEGAPTRAEVDGVPLVLVRQAGNIHALYAHCAHFGGPLHEGTLEGDALRCPWHRALFRLSDGQVLEGPAVHSAPCFQTRVTGGQIEVKPARRWD